MSFMRLVGPSDPASGIRARGTRLHDGYASTHRAGASRKPPRRLLRLTAEPPQRLCQPARRLRPHEPEQHAGQRKWPPHDEEAVLEARLELLLPVEPPPELVKPLQPPPPQPTPPPRLPVH